MRTTPSHLSFSQALQKQRTDFCHSPFTLPGSRIEDQAAVRRRHVLPFLLCSTGTFLKNAAILPSGPIGAPTLARAKGQVAGRQRAEHKLSFLCRSPHFPMCHYLTCSILLVQRSLLSAAVTARPLYIAAAAARVTARSLLVHVDLV